MPRRVLYKIPQERIYLGEYAESTPGSASNFETGGKTVCANDKGIFKHLWLEACYRRSRGTPGPVIRHADSVLDFMRTTLPGLLDDQREAAFLLMLNTKHRIVGVYDVGRGGYSSTSVDPKVVARSLALAGASAFIFVHNHPSGETTPSMDDGMLTKRLFEIGSILGAKMLDAVIVGRNPTNGEAARYSFVENYQPPFSTS